MAKTFEAMQKFGQIAAEKRGAGSHVSDWNFLNLKKKSGLKDILSKMGIESNSDKSHTFHFASARDREGTTTILVNLARFLIDNKSTRDVLFIDGNIEKPKFHLAFHLPQSPGVSEALLQRANLSEAIHKIDTSAVSVMPSGNSAIYDQIGLEPQKVIKLVKTLHQKFQVIIIDAPPLLSSPNSLLWANAADVSFMVIQANQTQWEVAQKAQILLEKTGCKIGGVVLNRVKHSIPAWLYRRL